MIYILPGFFLIFSESVAKVLESQTRPLCYRNKEIYTTYGYDF